MIQRGSVSNNAIIIVGGLSQTADNIFITIRSVMVMFLFVYVADIAKTWIDLGERLHVYRLM